MVAYNEGIETIIGRSIDRELRARMKEHILKVIEPDVVEMVNAMMKEFEPQIRHHRDNILDQSILEIMILDKREPKK